MGTTAGFLTMTTLVVIFPLPVPGSLDQQWQFCMYLSLSSHFSCCLLTLMVLRDKSALNFSTGRNN